MSEMNVLFIAPKFFSYEEAIKREMENLGYTVDLYDERPASTPLIKALIRFFPKLVSPISEIYFNHILKKKKFDYYHIVLVIKGEALSIERIKKFKQKNPSAKFIYYTWDALKNFKNGREKLSFFDKAYSFDRHDSKSIKKIKHLPLFYTAAYQALGVALPLKLDIDLLFLGSIHSDRYPVMNNISAAAKKVLKSVKIHTHFYYQSKWVFFVKKILDINFKKMPWNDISWISLNELDTLSMISRSKVVIDIHHPGQTGLTMRTIECIGAKKKMITTNGDVVNYDFYNSKNIMVVDRKNPVVEASFLQEEYVELDSVVYEKYSINTWVREILS
ncbi:hypothetical protein [Glaciimonas immobilis]|uniref:Lipopolysaccharide biosynthesis protein n=1 Tax=Glaciimonas immobilis TaxID=728004 RepID=A0A840RWT2_9BURK|nr:hypothetical protein [Glaciimonas immobilis]KAF3997450.1 hypothetical protein HAV38_12260 [Glaciimonas immobilis]MBB5200879.1 hypothetical protein [Glaciimonas immobilis]